MMLSGYPAPCAAAASEARPVVASAVANETKLSSSAFKNFDEIEDADINPGPAPASKMITLPTLKKTERRRRGQLPLEAHYGGLRGLLSPMAAATRR